MPLPVSFFVNILLVSLIVDESEAYRQEVKMSQRRQKLQWLKRSILVGLLACSWASVTQAEEYAAPITGIETNDTLYKDKGILDEDGEYYFAEGGIIKVNSTHAANKIIAGIRSDGNVVLTTMRPLTLHAAGTNADETAAGIYAIKPVQVTNSTTDPLQIHVQSTGTAYGIYAGSGTTEDPTGGQVDIEGGLVLNVSGDQAYGLYVAENTNLDWNKVEGGNITIKGPVTLNLSGTNQTGVYIGPSIRGSSVNVEGKFTLQTDQPITVLNTVNDDTNRMAGRITLQDADIKTAGFIGDMSGGITIGKGNLESTSGIAFRMRPIVGSQFLVIGNSDGGEIHLKGDIERNTKPETTYVMNSGSIIIYLDPNSTWEGKFTGANTFTRQDEFYNAGLWKNTGSGTINCYGTDKSFDTTKIGTIYQTKESGELIFVDWRRMMNGLFVYDHDADDPAHILGGNIIFKKSDSYMPSAPPPDWLPTVTLRTDSTGLPVNSEEPEDQQLVVETLNALANKFWLEDYTKYGRVPIVPSVEIAEGLTTTSARLAGGPMLLKLNGQGTYCGKVQTGTDFTETLTGTAQYEEGDEEYINNGVYRSDEIYTFSKDSKIHIVSDGEAKGIELSNSAVLEIEKDLEIIAEGKAGSAGIDANYQRLQINPLADSSYTSATEPSRTITIKAKSEEGFARGIHFTNGGYGITGPFMAVQDKAIAGTFRWKDRIMRTIRTLVTV